LNFEKKIINPDILKDDWPRCVSNDGERSGAT
jgi:hypothetical protein